MVVKTWAEPVRPLEFVEGLQLRLEPIQVGLGPDGGQVVAVHRAPELLLRAVEDASGGVAHSEAEVVDQATGVLAAPAICSFPGTVYVLAQPSHENLRSGSSVGSSTYESPIRLELPSAASEDRTAQLEMVDRGLSRDLA